MDDPVVNFRFGKAAPWRWPATVLAVAVFASAATWVAAQPTATEEQVAPSEDAASADSARPAVPESIRKAEGRIQYVGPDTYILLDAEGRPQPVPGMTYEDFMAAWKQSQQAGSSSSQPRFVLERVEIDGQVKEGRAELRFTAIVQLMTEEPTDVPLGLVGAILQGAPRFSRDQSSRTEPRSASESDVGREDTQDFLYFNQERGGFIAHLSGAPGERRQIELTLLVPLTREGTETTLALSCPRALASNFSLVLDRPVTDVNANAGVIVSQERRAQGGSEIKIAGAVGPFRMSWQTSEADAGGIGSVLSAEGAIRVSIDGRSVRTDARLTVRSYGGSFDRFRVRLPPGAQLVHHDPPASEAEAPAYRVQLDSEFAAEAVQEGGGANTRFVLVELQEKQPGPVTIELSTEQPIGLQVAGSMVELGGFEVVGAVRQFGDLALEVASDWQARWQIGENVRQVDPSELDALLQHAGLTGAFQYDRQPWSLLVGIVARQFRVHVTPRYSLECGSDEARLTVHLAYQVFGSRAFEFRVRLAGWEMPDEPVDSGGLVDQERVHDIQEGNDKVLVLPLAQSSSRRAEISFSTRRPLSREARRIELPLPVPIADAVGSGTLAARGAAEVELRPDLLHSVGLIAAPLSEPASDATDVAAFGHRLRTSAAELVFAAEKLNRAREISVDGTARVEVDPAAARIEQQFNYNVQFEAIKELMFEMPPGIPLDENMQMSLVAAAADAELEQGSAETPLNFIINERSPTTDYRSDGARQRRSVRVALPQARLGRFAILVRYTIARPSSTSDGVVWPLPLPQALDGRQSAVRARVHAPQAVSVALDAKAAGSSWSTASAPAEAADATAHEFAADRFESALPLIVRTIDASLPSATTIERVWLQTWLARDIRQDRVAYRLRTRSAEATVELPPQLRPAAVEVLLDRAPAEVLSREDGRIVCRIPAPDNRGSDAQEETHCTLELRYRQPVRHGILTRYRLTPPQVVGTTELSQVYWQIVLPADHHVIRSPERLIAAGQWQWLGGFWGRRPVLSQAELERWSDASAQQAPTDGQNEYLFSGLAPISTIEIVTAPRWLVVFAASAAVIALVLPWVYLPAVRQTWTLVALACLIGGLAIAFPGAALLFGQASVLGIVLAAVAVVFARLTAPLAAVPIVLSAGSTQRQPASRGDSFVIPAIPSAASTAPTASLLVSDSER